MKIDFDNLDLRNAFREEPERCHQALMNAARSVQEEEKTMKRTPIRTLLIAAVVVLSMLTTAFAAGEIFGWTDFLGEGGAQLPQDAVKQMQHINGDSWEVGPFTFTVKELLTDGRIALSSVHIATTDGSPALLCADPYDVVGANGENGRAYADKLGIDPMTTWVEAAKQLDLPLYNVRGIIDLAAEYSSGDGYEDPLWSLDGSMTYFCLISLNAEKVQDELPVQFFLRATKIDLATAEDVETWVDREQCVTIPVQGILEKKTYQPTDDVVIAGLKLERIDAQRYVTGAYVDCVFTAGEGVTEDDAYKLYDLTIRDTKGNELPGGVDLSASVDVSNWPTVVLHDLFGVEQLPDGLYLSYDVYMTSK